METDISNNQVSSEEEKMSRSLKKFLLVLNGAMLGIGNCGGPLIQRLYFLKGGKGVWISCFLQTAGWPFIIFPLSVSYLYRRRKKGSRTKLFYISPHLFLACAVTGVLTGFDDFLAASGVSLLPVTTYSLIIATQLGFTAGFAYILVKQKFTPFTINAIFLLSVGAVVLVLHASSDRPAHETDKQYIRVCTIGMLLHKDFEAIPREARDFELGRAKYYAVMVCTAVFGNSSSWEQSVSFSVIPRCSLVL
ncbi:hypothetical protein GH714_027543 [Hevea brasiliensis]|uniref:Uncharacterized protein n=1 Tax=Hevea brasiliensis TaxID=3981 RepID=A0A6A6N2W1_HEVBR|nr:hypothetical protein GH714_027543 [Hevea brasiliensis]